MLRHSKVAITVDLYGHLSPETAGRGHLRAVVDAAAAELAAEHAAPCRPKEIITAPLP